jgi:hypothetical protein
VSRCFHKFPVNLGQDTTADKTTFDAANEIFVSRLTARALQHARTQTYCECTFQVLLEILIRRADRGRETPIT